jgi:hypothetical protein
MQEQYHTVEVLIAALIVIGRGAGEEERRTGTGGRDERGRSGC